MLALRAVVADKALLHDLNAGLYPAVLVLSPATFHLIDLMTGRRFVLVRAFSYMTLAATLLGAVAIFLGRAFTDRWLPYSFGNYPVGGPLLAPWAILSVLGYYVAALPACIRHMRTLDDTARQRDLPFMLGLNIQLFLISTNLPSLLGIAWYPGAAFGFIGLAIMAYGIFRADFLDLGDLLFQKNGLFYFANIVLMLSFLGVAALVAYGLVPDALQATRMFPWVLIPLASAVAAFGFGIVVAGTNPSIRLNQFAALALFIYGFQQITAILATLPVTPIVSLRLHQLCYLFFMPAVSVQLRFIYYALGRDPPRQTILFDVAAVVLCLFAPTQYLFTGYYEHAFGRALRAGPLLDVFSVVGALALTLALTEWWRVRRERPNRLADVVVLYVVTGSLLLFGNLPSVRGFPIYPPANFMFLPTIVLAYAILRFGALAVQPRALLVSRRMSAILFVLLLAYAAYLIPAFARSAPPFEAIGYAILLFSPLFLTGFQFTFLFSRPLAADLDASYARVEEERQRAESMFAEVQELNDFSRRINEAAQVDEITIFIMRSLLLNFNIQSIVVFLRDERTGRFLCGGSSLESDVGWNPEEVVFSDSQPGNLHAAVARRRRPVFLRRDGFGIAVRDEALRRIFEMGARVWIVPLSVHGSTIGLLDLFSTAPGWRVSRAEAARLGRFCDQSAGALRTALLMQSAQEERRRAERAREDAEMLARLARTANESRTTHEILAVVFALARDRFGADTLGLYVTAGSRLELRSFLLRGAEVDVFSFPSIVSMVPLAAESGTLYRTFGKKKPFYLPRINHAWLEGSPVDKAIAETIGLQWFVHLPLLIEGDVVGILVLTGSGGERRFTTGDLELAERIAAQTAGAVRAMELLGKSPRSRRGSAAPSRGRAPRER